MSRAPHSSRGCSGHDRCAKREGVLAKERGLPVKGKPVQIQRGRSVGENVRIDGIGADPVVETQAGALNDEARIEPLRAGSKIHAARAIIRVEIFEPRGPVRRQRDLDAGTGHGADARHHEQGFLVARTGRPTRRGAGQLHPRELVVGPGEAARGVQPLWMRLLSASSRTLTSRSSVRLKRRRYRTTEAPPRPSGRRGRISERRQRPELTTLPLQSRPNASPF
jgi:hypothetical protein